MKKNFLFSIIVIFFFLFFAFEVKAAGCSYSYYHVVNKNKIDDNVGSAYKDAIIKNVKKKDGKWWGDSESSLGTLGGDENIKKWSGDSCPDFIGVVSKVFEIEWYGISADRVLKEGTNLDNEYLGEDDSFILYKNDDLDMEKVGIYSCPYSDFYIEFNEKGYPQKAYSTHEDSIYTSFIYEIFEEMKNKPFITIDNSQEFVAKNNCKDVYYCLTESKEGNINGVITQTNHYLIFPDDIVYEKNKSKCKDNFIVGIIHEDAGDYNTPCSSYSEYIDKLKSLHESCSNEFHSCEDYNKIKNEITSICKSITQYADYTKRPCLRSCLNLNKDISKIEKTSREVGECGFSGRLILFVGNIIKWCKYIVPVIVIVLSILDFIKAIGAGKEDEMKKAQGKFIKRLIVAGLVFIMPFIIEFILNKMGFEANGCGIIDL